MSIATSEILLYPNELTASMIARGAVAAISNILYGIEIPSPNPLYYYDDTSNNYQFYLYHGTVPSPAIYESQIKAFIDHLNGDLRVCQWYFYVEAAGNWQRKNRELVSMMQGWSGWKLVDGDPTELGAVALAKMKTGYDRSWIDANYTKKGLVSILKPVNITTKIDNFEVYKFEDEKNNNLVS